MPRGPSEAIVTKFLRDALAVDAVGVPELDEKARAKGLLGERQSITHCEGIQTREEISWHKVASGWIWSSQSVAVAITTTERRLPQNGQEPRENVAVPFQSIGSRGSRVSTLIVRPMTSLGTVGGSS